MPHFGPSFPVVSQKYVEIKYLLRMQSWNHILTTCLAREFPRMAKMILTIAAMRKHLRCRLTREP
jgi:hypothetical protein